MMLILTMAWRNIFRQRRRTLLTGAAMIAGFVLLSFDKSILDGTFNTTIDAFTRTFTGHVQIHKKGYLDKPGLYETMSGIEAIGKKVRTMPGVQSWTPRIYSGALAFIGKKTTAARIIGVDPAREPKTLAWEHKISQGRFFNASDIKTVILGSTLADLLGAKPGDEVVLIAQGADGSIANDIFKTIGIVAGGTDSTGSRNCYLPLGEAQAFLSLPDQAHEITVILRDFSRSQQAARDITAALRDPGIEAMPWQVVEKKFYDLVLSKQKSNGLAMLVVMCIVAIGMLNTVLMSILERTREFGVLKALGTRPRFLAFLIILETGILSLLAVGLGTLLSLACNSWMTVHGIRYPSPMDVGGVVLQTLVGTVNWATWLYPTLTTLVTALAVSVLPALRAARMKPVEALRK